MCDGNLSLKVNEYPMRCTCVHAFTLYRLLGDACLDFVLNWSMKATVPAILLEFKLDGQYK